MRSIIVIPFLFGFLAIKASGSLRLPDALGWTILRSLLLVAMWVSYYLSLLKWALLAAAAAYYTLPIFITLFSAIIMGEKISRTGWLAVVLGFAGAILVLRPEAGDFNWYALLPLISAIFYALAMILPRTKCRSEHPIILYLALNISFVVVGGVSAAIVTAFSDEARQGFLLAPWAQMGVSEWRSMSLLAAAILIGSVGVAISYQNGPPINDRYI